MAGEKPRPAKMLLARAVAESASQLRNAHSVNRDLIYKEKET
jgi:hypothetical protein